MNLIPFVVHSHELYNMGHLYEARHRLLSGDWQGPSYSRWRRKTPATSTGSFSRETRNTMVASPSGKPLVIRKWNWPLVKLYKVTEKKLYLEMATKFLEIRGRPTSLTGRA